MRRVLAAAAAIGALAVTGCGGAGGDAPVPRTLAYAAASLDGEPVSLADVPGPAVLTSWATWCVECKEELPSLERLWRARRSEGLAVVAVNVDRNGIDRRVRSMARELDLTMPIWRDGDNRYSAVLGTIGVPTSVLLDARHRVVAVWLGATDFQEPAVAAAIDRVLAQA